ncbi:FMN-dependent NADH-azoreductase [Nocardiopsis sp. CNT312]|uniref:FMN-dependent NADH-azoreductase n=1 Tax=Nocardiopsis sp. CNT312 TaxID=1137268 RepID=UPI00048EF834|nr:NAD(P)H-dependent oxidoreductase [Nocardiopsis sp. CNT312]
MNSLLHLDSSHSGDSLSRQLTALFARRWRRLSGTEGYRYRNLATHPVPTVGPVYCSFAQKVERHGTVSHETVDALARSTAERREWTLTRPLITELLKADVVLIGAPMYNFTIPASLKGWIDRITFPGAFTGADSGEPLLRGTRVVVVTTRGGGYGPGTPRERFDFQTPYLRAYFGGLGIAEEDLYFVHTEMTRAGDVPELHRFQEMAALSRARAESLMAALPEQLAARPAQIR